MSLFKSNDPPTASAPWCAKAAALNASTLALTQAIQGPAVRWPHSNDPFTKTQRPPRFGDALHHNGVRKLVQRRVLRPTQAPSRPRSRHHKNTAPRLRCSKSGLNHHRHTTIVSRAGNASCIGMPLSRSVQHTGPTPGLPGNCSVSCRPAWHVPVAGAGARLPCAGARALPRHGECGRWSAALVQWGTAMQRRLFLSTSVASSISLAAPWVHAQGALTPLKFTLDFRVTSQTSPFFTSA